MTKPPLRFRYRMPGEWEPHVATALLPRGKELASLIRSIAYSGFARNGRGAHRIRASLYQHRKARMKPRLAQSWMDIDGTHHVLSDSNERPWCRDHGPIFSPAYHPRLAIVDWITMPGAQVSAV